MSNASTNVNCNRSPSGRGNYDDDSDPDYVGRLNQAGLIISRLGDEQTGGPPFVSGWITAPSVPFEGGATGESFGQLYDAYPALRLPSSSQIRNGSLYLDLLSQGASEQEAYNTQEIHLILQLACVLVIDENDE